MKNNKQDIEKSQRDFMSDINKHIVIPNSLYKIKCLLRESQRELDDIKKIIKY